MPPQIETRPTRYDPMARAKPADTAPYLGSKSHPATQAGNSPNVAYKKLRAEPLLGYRDVCSANINAVTRQRSPPVVNDKKSEGPLYWTARPIRAKIPAPIVFPKQ